MPNLGPNSSLIVVSMLFSRFGRRLKVMKLCSNHPFGSKMIAASSRDLKRRLSGQNSLRSQPDESGKERCQNA
jgi:hypothetical protein